MASHGVPVAPVGGPNGRIALIALGAIVASLLLAIAKPWAGPGAGTIPTAAASPASASAAPERSAPAESAPAIEACQAGAGWRLFVVEANAGRSGRTWYSMEPVAAAGPNDSTIPTIRVYAEALQRLGYCAETTIGRLRPILGTEAWRVPATGPARAIHLMAAREPGVTDPNLGALFIPPKTRAGTSPTAWPPGRYVFVVRFGPTSPAQWFAAEVIAVSIPTASP